MAIIRYNPFRGFEGLARQMNDFMNVFDNRRAFEFERGAFFPKVDISEDENNIFIHADIPGLSKEEIKVSVNDENLLIIKGEKKSEQKQEDKTHIRIERNFGSFLRSFVLPENVNKDEISAKYENGVLSLSLKKIAPVKPKELDVAIS